MSRFIKCQKTLYEMKNLTKKNFVIDSSSKKQNKCVKNNKKYFICFF